MALIFLFLQWPALSHQDGVLVVREQVLWQADLAKLRWDVLPGKPLSQFLKGFVLEHEGIWLWADGELHQLPAPAPNQDYIPTNFENMTLPCLLTLEHLWLWRNNAWEKFPSHNSANCLPPGQAGSLFGLDVTSAHWVWADGHLMAFQNRENKVWLYFSEKEKELDRKADKLFLLNERPAWLGWGKDERLELAHYQAGQESSTTLSVPQLDKHALHFKTQNGTWFFTFDDGMMAALDAWKTKKIEVKAHFIQNGNRTTRNLGELPLRFEMGTSGSGSPKLLPHPDFEVLPLLNSDVLCISLDEKSLWLGPSSLKEKPKMNFENDHHLVDFQEKIYWLGPDFICTLKEKP